MNQQSHDFVRGMLADRIGWAATHIGKGAPNTGELVQIISQCTAALEGLTSAAPASPADQRALALAGFLQARTLDGSLDAVRNELMSGQPTGPKHPATRLVSQLHSFLSDPNATSL